MSQGNFFQTPSEWVPPEVVPDLTDAKEIAIDLETKDDGLNKSMGPGWATKSGRVIGVAIAVEGWEGYYPIAHEGGHNLDAKVFTNALKPILELPCDKIFHNAIYDVGWLDAMGLKVNGRIVDTMVAAPLVDENRRNYSLRELSRHYVGETKSETLLYEAAAEYGVNPKSEMWKLPPMYVGPYAEQDAAVTLKLWKALQRKIIQGDLTDIFNLESELFHVLFAMKKKGVRIDLDKAATIKVDFEKEENKVRRSLNKTCGFDLEILSPLSIAKAFDKLKIEYSKTPSGLPAFDKNFLLNQPSKFAQDIVKAREFNKARTTFVDSILKHAHNGRIHADVNQMRSETGGTISGRLSMQNPNLQQMPTRNQNIGPKIRELFIPEEGEQWGCFDYSQQEPRLLAHYGALVSETTSWEVSSVNKLVKDYNENPDTDFHQVVADMAGIDRKQAKTINLGMMYGMGRGKLGSQLGLDIDDAKEVFEKYHTTVPFVKALTDGTMKKAADVGEIRTLLGRVCRFDMWEPNMYGLHQALKKEEAERKHGGMNRIRRAFTYRALNRLIQGSAADQTKKAMVDIFKEGITPLIQVHDELDISIYDEDQKKRIIEIMENTVPLRVPSQIDCEVGPSWGEIG